MTPAQLRSRFHHMSRAEKNVLEFFVVGLMHGDVPRIDTLSLRVMDPKFLEDVVRVFETELARVRVGLRRWRRRGRPGWGR